MAITETINAEIIPLINIASSIPLNVKPNFISFNKLAPNIVGIAKKNVNSADKYLEAPINIAPIIVAPDLDVPGKIERT